MGKILWSSLLLKPYFMHPELLWSTCQASIWPKPVPQPHIQIYLQGMERSQIQATGYLSNKTLGSILAQATSRHRAMPADSWTTPLRNAEKVPEGMRLRSLFIVICHQLSSVLSRTLLSMEKVASQVMRKQFGPSVGSRKIPAPWYFPSLSVL